MTNTQKQRKSAKEFADFWKDKGYEKGDTQPFYGAVEFINQNRDIVFG